MLKDNWLERQLKSVRELVEQGGQHVRDNQLVEAESKLDEARKVLASAETITDEVLQLRVTVFSDLAMIATQTGDPSTAAGRYGEALTAADELASRGTNSMWMERGTILVNLGGIHSALGRAEEAISASQCALDMFIHLDASVGVELMTVFARYHLGAGHLLAGQQRMAADILTQAAQDGSKLEQTGVAEVNPILVEIFSHTARARATLGEPEAALECGGRATELSMSLWESTGAEEHLAQYLQAELDMVSFYQSLDQFDQAEDSLFKVLDLVPDNPDVMDRGKSFYDSLLTRTDEELEAGGLPREEVEESQREILARRQNSPAP